MYITVACQKEQIYFLNNINALKKKNHYWIFTNMLHIVKKKGVTRKLLFLKVHQNNCF